MGKTILLQDQFDRIWRDGPRDRLPEGAVWSMTDCIPGEVDAPLAKRGGWAYASENLTSILASANYVLAVAHAPFASGDQLVAVVYNSGGPAMRVGQVVSTSSTTDRGAGLFPAEHPTFYRDSLYITDSLGSTDPLRYQGASNAAALTGSPPNGSKSEVYKDHLVLASDSATKQRVWFSAAGDPTSWDTTNGYIDSSAPVTGLWALRNALLVFHDARTERIVGSVPPPGTDMSLQPIFDVGTTDARSLAGTDDFVCFANASGAYMTDGAAVADLTQQGGIKSYWATQVAAMAAIATPVTYAGGFFRSYYFLSIFVGGYNRLMACHIESRRWFELTNTVVMSFGRRLSGGTEELYAGMAGSARVISLSSIFNPSGTVKADGNGTAVTPVIELPFYQTGNSKGTFRNVFPTYDIRDAASDNPTLTMSYITSPESTSYTAVTDFTGTAYPLAETTQMERVKRKIHKGALGIGLKLAQTNASEATRLYRIELEAEEREQTNVG